jgi:hypothetical protein
MLNGLQCVIFWVIHCSLRFEVHCEPIVQAVIVSILLTEKMLLCFKYFIEMKYYVVFFIEPTICWICVLDDLNYFKYVEIWQWWSSVLRLWIWNCMLRYDLMSFNACCGWGFRLYFDACYSWDLNYANCFWEIDMLDCLLFYENIKCWDAWS